jgi:hypothetical protein
MSRLVSKCPSCEGELQVARLACTSCKTQLEGAFDIPALLRLPPEDLAFVAAFVRRSGSLKAMAEMEGSSYPTVRNRLNDIIRRLEDVERTVERRRHEILDALENGKMSASAAAKALRKEGL